MNGKKNLMRLTTTALLMALIVLLGLTPLGFINIGVVNATLLCIPVIVGTLAMGRNAGLLLGLCMGVVSFGRGINAPSPLFAPIVQSGWLNFFILCHAPRILVPVVTASVVQVFKGKREKISFVVASVFGSLTNTIIMLGFTLIFYIWMGIANPAFLATLVGIVLTAGLPEAFLAAIISPPILIALKKAGLLKRL